MENFAFYCEESDFFSNKNKSALEFTIFIVILKLVNDN